MTSPLEEQSGLKDNPKLQETQETQNTWSNDPGL